VTEKDYPDYPAGLHVRRDTGEPGTVVEQHSEMITVERESGGKVPAPDPLVSPPDGKVSEIPGLPSPRPTEAQPHCRKTQHQSPVA
jgi:hypothetical protein